MRDAIAEMPDGVYEGEDLLDCDAVDADEEYTIKVKVKIAGPRLEVDLSRHLTPGAHVHQLRLAGRQDGGRRSR